MANVTVVQSETKIVLEMSPVEAAVVLALVGMATVNADVPFDVRTAVLDIRDSLSAEISDKRLAQFGAKGFTHAHLVAYTDE